MKAHNLALIPLFMASTAMAEPATEEGAQHLTEVFQTYLGTTEGVVSVEASEDSYTLTIDINPLIALGKDAGLTGTVSPYEFTLEDNGDGTWAVSRDDATSIALSVPNAFDLKVDAASDSFEGVFDEKLMTFTSIEGSFEGVKLSETVKDPAGAVTTAEVALDKGSYTGTGAAGAADGVDSTLTLTASGVSETISAPAGAGQPPVPVTVTVEGVKEDFKGTGFAMEGIYKLVAWAVAHPNPEAAKADKAGLKTLVAAAAPFFGNMAATGTMSKLTVGTPIGPVALDEVAFAVDMNGAVADGKLREAFSVSGLTLPPGIVPDWAAPILPKKVSLDVQVTGFDAAAALTTALTAFDLPEGTPPGPEFQAALQAALLPKGSVTVTLNPGAVSGDGYELTHSGSLDVGPNAPMPTGKATVTLTGADKLQTALQAAPDDVKAQALGAFGMAQGFAKQDGDKLVWDIDASTPGSVSVNGTPLMGGN